MGVGLTIGRAGGKTGAGLAGTAGGHLTKWPLASLQGAANAALAIPINEKAANEARTFFMPVSLVRDSIKSLMETSDIAALLNPSFFVAPDRHSRCVGPPTGGFAWGQTADHFDSP